MPDEIKCPKCGQPPARVGAFWICEVHGQLPEAKPFTPLRLFLSYGQRLPDWLGLVVTSRPEFDVKTPLRALNPFPLDTQSESNRTDLREYLRRELETPLQNRPDADRLVEQILEKSEGVFVYVERFCRAPFGINRQFNLL